MKLVSCLKDAGVPSFYFQSFPSSLESLSDDDESEGGGLGFCLFFLDLDWCRWGLGVGGG